MTLTEVISNALKEAMKSKDVLTLETVRMAKAALKNKEIEKFQQPLTEAEGLAVLQTLVKQRQESAEQFRKGGREELAQKEEAEIVILRKFLPTPLSDVELEAIVKETISALSATDIKQMGAVIKEVMAKTSGRAEGGRVSAAVKKALTSA